jgi:hypothetical protein
VGEYDGALVTAREALRPPAAPPKSVQLGQAIRSLGQLLPEELRINGELHAAAVRLVPGLRCLADAIDTLGKHLADASPTDPRAGPLQSGQQELQALVPRLVGLVEAHTGWQQIDQALALAAALPPGPPADRVPRWARVKTLLGRHSAPPAPGALGPVELAEKIEKAENPADAEPLFQDLRAMTVQEFVTVDADLYALTGEMTANVLQPLRALLGVI